MREIQDSLVIRIGMDGGHQPSFDPEVLMQNLCEGRDNWWTGMLEHSFFADHTGS
jgi:hypothetical protein